MPSKTAQMAGAFDNIHPGLSQQEAIRLLMAPLETLESQSDPYMAAAHLINFPGEATEQALLRLVIDAEQAQPRRLARRKAVEVLARLGCRDAIPSIGRCLQSDDPYLVENAAFALKELRCQDAEIHATLVSLVDQPSQNQRVLIQSLAALGVDQALPSIQKLLQADSPGVRGAAISAMAQLGGGRESLQQLEDSMLLPNQMDRQSAIQDAIDAHAVELLPQILKAPVSPVFRMRAVKALWPQDVVRLGELNLFSVLDALVEDRPECLQVVHAYDQDPTNEFLIQEFFGTDFSRCYLALQNLASRSAEDLWPLLHRRWLDEAHNDYGAHYFFIRLFALLGDTWPQDARAMIQHILEEAIKTPRPQFMKSKPAAVLALSQLGFLHSDAQFKTLLDPALTSFWECRYAAVMVAPKTCLQGVLNDPSPFVAVRARELIKAV